MSKRGDEQVDSLDAEKYRWLLKTYSVSLLSGNWEFRIPFGFKGKSVIEIDKSIAALSKAQP